MTVAVVTDSASSLPQEHVDRLEIGVVTLYVTEDGHSVPETDIDLPVFYGRLPEMRVLPTTSQPSPGDFAEAFEPIVDRGDDVLAVLISTKMSSTLHAAELGAASIRERHPGARISLVDSESNSMQEGFAVLSAAECAAGGGDLVECEAAARATMSRTRFLFAPASLEYLSRGGRISGAARLLGSALSIVPILTAADGAAGVAGIVRTHTRALARIATLMAADIDRFGFKRAVVQTVADDEGATRFAGETIEPLAGSSVPVVPAAVAVGIHVGPAIGVAYETLEPIR